MRWRPHGPRGRRAGLRLPRRRSRRTSNRPPRPSAPSSGRTSLSGARVAAPRALPRRARTGRRWWRTTASATTAGAAIRSSCRPTSSSARTATRGAPSSTSRRWRRHADAGSPTGCRPHEINFPDGSWYRVARLPLRPGYRTESHRRRAGRADDGPRRRRPRQPAADHLAHDVGARQPRLRRHDAADPDQPVVHRRRRHASWSTVPRRTTDVDLPRLVDVWTATSEQDWQLCEANYAGLCSPAYRPGPLSQVVEASVEHFLQWYTARLDGHPTP